MSHLVTPYGTFNLIQYDTEQEFERAIVAHVSDIFGERRIYLDCKRRIGAKDGKVTQLPSISPQRVSLSGKPVQDQNHSSTDAVLARTDELHARLS